MTIGIGVICHEAKCIIMAADTRGSFADPALPPHEHIGKQFDLPFGFVATTAGEKALCQSFANELYEAMQKLKSEPTIYHDHIRRAIRDTQLYEFEYRVDQEMATKLCTRVADWQKMDSTSLHYRRCQRLVNGYFLNIHIMVGGFLSDGSPVLLNTYSKYAPEMEDHCAIGSAMDTATDVLTARGQNSHMGSVRSLLHVYEALEAARATDRYVGAPADILFLTPGQIRLFPAKHPLLAQLAQDYSGKDTKTLDDDVGLLKRFGADLYHPGTTREEYDAGLRSPRLRSA